MLSLTLWRIDLFLWLTILVGGFRARSFGKYPFFYAYSFSAFLGEVFLYAIWTAHSPAYQKYYWRVQFLTLVIGCGIILEIFRHVLAPYPGADKFATAVGLLIFGAIFCFALFYKLLALNWSLSATGIELERNVRTVQAIFLFSIFAVISYYGISIGKNLKGMTLGYGIYIATSLLTLAVRSYAGVQFNGAWNIIQPSSFDLTQLTWTVALWSYHPNPVPDSSIHLEEDYEAMAARTKRALGAMRSRLARAGRT
jgi:hypothetical protein